MDNFKTIRIRVEVLSELDALVERISEGFALGAKTTRSEVISKAIQAYARELGDGPVIDGHPTSGRKIK